MAHQLHVKNGKASMFYTGETPWHRLGQELASPATAEEAIAAANLDYRVEKKVLRAVINPVGDESAIVPGHFATVRTDTNEVLGVVGSRYCPIQNRDAFRFFDALVGEGEAIYHTAGALGKGERIWILAKLPDYIRVNGDDVVEKYLLLTNSHDGKSMVRAKLTPIRVVCHNTLSAALEGAEKEVHIAHTAGATARLDEAHKLLGLSNQLYDQLDGIFTRMSLARCTDAMLLDYVKKLVPDNPEVENHSRTESIRNTILEAYAHVGMNAEGSWWGAYNAVSEYTDHYITKDTNDDRMLKSIWFGAKESLKKQAFTLALRAINNQ